LLTAIDILHWQRYTQSETGSMENDMPSKWKPKATRSSYAHIWQSRCQAKIIQKTKGHYLLLKETVHHEDITIVNVYVPNVGKFNFIKQVVLYIKRLINTAVIIGNLNTPFSLIDRSSRQKESTKTLQAQTSP
jgi:hypothetical protein